MTPRAESIIATLRAVLAAVDDHEKTHPEEAASISSTAGAAFAQRARLDLLGEPRVREPRPSDVRPVDAMRIFNERTRSKAT